jgi:hypothetical protein
MGVFFEIADQSLSQRILEAIAHSLPQLIIAPDGTIVILGLPQWSFPSELLIDSL